MKIFFGIFCNGENIIRIGMPIECSPLQAEIIGTILSLIDAELEKGHYVAYDYTE